MRTILISVALTALAGCAQQQPMRVRPVAEATDYELCQAVILGNHGPGGQPVVENERIRRGLDCAPYSQAIVQQDAARRQMALQMLQASRPQPITMPILPPPQFPTTTNCTSTRYGNQVQTTCR